MLFKSLRAFRFSLNKLKKTKNNLKVTTFQSLCLFKFDFLYMQPNIVMILSFILKIR